jgi:hypothetical protein
LFQDKKLGKGEKVEVKDKVKRADEYLNNRIREYLNN